MTHDHSPVGEREDAGELSEAEAMRHPRRNEIFRDVGSEPHNPDDERLHRDRGPAVPRRLRPPDLFSDGLSDLVGSPAIAGIVYGHAAAPDEVVARLVEAANREGGKDNVTVVFAAGPRFAERGAGARRPDARRERAAGQAAGSARRVG